MRAKYYINNIEVYPVNAGTERYKFDKKNVFDIVLTKTIETELIFNYVSGGFNFKTQELTNVSEELNFTVKTPCNGTYSTFYEGVFAVCEGSFDDDACIFKVKIRNREFILEDVQVNIFGLSLPMQNGTNIGVFTGSGGGARNYTNALTFDSVILNIAKRTNLGVDSIVSNFFQINPTTVSTECLPGVTNYFTKMAFCSLSDVQEPIPSGSATFETISFTELMDDLNVIFDVFYYTEGSTLHIEHRLFFEGDVGLDLTQSKYSAYTKGIAKYTYDLSDYPKSEVWQIVDSRQYAKVTYNQISNLKKNTNEITRITKKIRTDYALIRYHGGSSTEDGLFLFATELTGGAYHMLESGGQNYKLSPSFLIPNIHTYERPYLTAVFETFDLYATNSFYRYGGFVAKSTSKSKLYNQFVIPFCCEDFAQLKNKVNTKYGVGYLDKADFDSKNDKLNIGLKFSNKNNFILSPFDVPGMDLFLDAELSPITYDGSFKVGQWNDISGNGRHATQNAPIFKPTYDPINKKIVFVNNYLFTPSFQLFPNKRGTIFVLFDKAGTSAAYYCSLVSTNNGGGGVDYDLSSAAQDIINLTNSTGLSQQYYPANQAPNGNESGLYVVNRNEDTKELGRHNSNIPFYGTYNPITVPNTQISSKPCIIGANPTIVAGLPSGSGGSTPTLPHNVKLILVYGRSLSDYEVQGIEYYLASRGIYGVYP